MPARRLTLLPLSVLSLVVVIAAGRCRLVDQRSFERAGPAPAASQLARSRLAAAERQPPLTVVFPGIPDRDWRPAAVTAVRDVLVRQPDAEFDIVAPFPSAADASVQQAALQQGREDTTAVAAAIAADGVAAERLHQGARGDSGRPPRMVLILMR